MINNDTPMSSANNTPSTSYAGLIHQRTLQDDVFYENVRVRFLMQSASYLGADMDDSTIESICSTSLSNTATVSNSKNQALRTWI
jgi:hypothetical protein